LIFPNAQNVAPAPVAVSFAPMRRVYRWTIVCSLLLVAMATSVGIVVREFDLLSPWDWPVPGGPTTEPNDNSAVHNFRELTATGPSTQADP
jgi:hypothetical protein